MKRKTVLGLNGSIKYIHTVLPADEGAVVNVTGDKLNVVVAIRRKSFAI